MNQPLASLKILDFSTLLPPFDGDTSAWHAVLNRNKRSLALDLKRPGAAEVVKRLVTAVGGGYDIVLEQFRPGVMERLGIDYAALRAVNPRVIVCAITGYGQTGPYKDRAGHDNNYMALSGVMSYTGRRTCGPVALGVQVADTGGGSFGAIMGILTAVIQRTHTGVGQLVDVSMLDMALAWQAHLASHYLVGGETPERERMPLNGGGLYDYYETQDGRFLSVASLEPKFWQGFCAAIGRPDLVGPGLQQDWAIQQQVKGEVREVIAQKTLAEWTAVFNPLDVCVEPVLTVPEALQHPQAQAREMVAHVPKPDGDTQPQIANPFKFSAAQAVYRHIGVPPGAHTDEVLAEIGYDTVAVARMRRSGMLG